MLLSSRIYQKYKDPNFPRPPRLWFLAGNPSLLDDMFHFVHYVHVNFSNLHIYSLISHYNFQIQNIFIPDESDPHGNWLKCKQNIGNCNPGQIEVLEGILLPYEYNDFLVVLAYEMWGHRWALRVEHILQELLSQWPHDEN